MMSIGKKKKNSINETTFGESVCFLNKRNGAEKSTSRLISNYTIVQPWHSRILLNGKLKERVWVTHAQSRQRAGLSDLRIGC